MLGFSIQFLHFVLVSVGVLSWSTSGSVQNFDRYGIQNLEEQDPFQRSRDAPIISWDRTWPHGIIFFDISPEFNKTDRELIYDAMSEITSKTCLQFQKRYGEPDYIYFEKKFGDGCHTHAGRKGGKQVLNLDPQKCVQHGKIMHELLHVAGFHHEHQRPDRDSYIKILWDNIKQQDKDQFDILRAPRKYLQEFPYDYGSILHYGNISFYLAIDREKPILLSRRYAPEMGQRVKLSNIDVTKLNALYECDRAGGSVKYKRRELWPDLVRSSREDYHFKYDKLIID